MRGASTLGPIAVAMALLAPPAAAAPAKDLIAVPGGWTEDVDPRARARADAWRGSDARTLAVLSTRARDDFAETLAVIELDGALDMRAPITDELRRALAGRSALPSEGVTIEENAVPSASPSARAKWIAGEVAHEAVLVPTGASRRLVLLAVRADELPLYRTTMTEALAGITGVATPIKPFETKRVRRTAIAAWGVVTALALGISMWRRPFGASARTIGRILAMACLVLAALTAALVWSPLEARGDELRLAGISATTLTAELVTYALIAAACCWITGVMLDRTEGPVSSAPTSGAFADRSRSIPRMPAVRDPSLPQQHPDGTSVLEPTSPDRPPGLP